jgi:ABC-2 type transport system ATP-binding protein
MPQLVMKNVSKTYPVQTTAKGIFGIFSKKFIAQEKAAVSDLSLSIDAGETVGYIGVNGSGKSTTVKLLTGILSPSEGQIKVFGFDPFKYRVQNARRMGVVFGQRSQLWWDLPLIDSLNMIQKLYGVSERTYQHWLIQLNTTLDLQEILNKPVRMMSLGQKMRAELIALLIHEPEVAFLDEPTIGLDLLAKEQIRSAITTLNQETGMTLFLTSHDLGDIQELCKRVVVIDRGVKVHDGSLEKLMENYGSTREIRVETTNLKPLYLPAGVQEMDFQQGSRVFQFDRRQISATTVVQSIVNQIEIDDFSISDASLESVVRRLYMRDFTFDLQRTEHV